MPCFLFSQLLFVIYSKFFNLHFQFSPITGASQFQNTRERYSFPNGNCQCHHASYYSKYNRQVSTPPPSPPIVIQNVLFMHCIHQPIHQIIPQPMSTWMKHCMPSTPRPHMLWWQRQPSISFPRSQNNTRKGTSTRSQNNTRKGTSTRSQNNTRKGTSTGQHHDRLKN